MIKRIAVILIAWLGLTSSLKGQWNQIYSSTPYAFINNIDYLQDSSVFVSIDKSVFFSLNNGNTFSLQSTFTISPTDPNYGNRIFADISYLNKDTGAVGGVISGGSSFVQTINAPSSTWKYKTPLLVSGGNTAIAVKYFPNNIIYAFDNKVNLFASYNSGSTWIWKNKLSNNFAAASYDMSFADSLNGYFFTNVGNFRTIDGGKTISAINLLPGNFDVIKRARFTSPLKGYVIAKNAASEEKLFKTTNGGVSWTDVFQGTFPDPIVDVNFPTNDTGYVISSNYALCTVDGGANWFIQRFPSSKTFYEMDFIHKERGMMVGRSGLSTEIFKLTSAANFKIPFCVFSVPTAYCCVSQACNIVNYASPSWSYKWYVNNALVSTAFTPSSLILPLAGNNAVKVVVSNVFGKDSTTVNVYNAPVNSYTINHSIVDSTICFGSPANINISGASTQYYYSVLSAANSISNTYNGTSFSMITNPLGFNDTILTIKAATQYSSCPGNIFTKNQNVKVWPLPPNNIMSFASDSVCYMDTAKAIINPLIAGTTYSLYAASLLHATYTPTISGGSKTFTYAPMWNSKRFSYKSYDLNGCYSVPSASLLVRVDSVQAKIYSVLPQPACYPGDTIKLINNSIATGFTWNYTPGTNVVLNNNYNVNTSYSAKGDYFIYLYATNNTGCKDSLRYRVGVYDTLTQGGGVSCLIDSTRLVHGKISSIPKWDIYTKLNVDRNENYYVGKTLYYGSSSSIIYGQIGFMVSKYDVNGILKWTVKPNYTSPLGVYYHSTLSSIISDDFGNIYISGNFDGNQLQIGNKSRAFACSSTFGGSSSAFVAKIDSMGKCCWIINAEGYPVTSLTPGVGAMVYSNSRIYISCLGASKYNYTNISMTTSSEPDLIVVDTAGKYVTQTGLYNLSATYMYGYCFMNPSAVNFNEVFNYSPSLNKYKNKLIHTGYLPDQTWLYPSFNPTIMPIPAAPAGNTLTAYSYIVITDTIGNITKAFCPAAFYNLINGHYTKIDITGTWEFKPNTTIDKSGNIYLSWAPTLDEPRKYKSRTYSEERYTIVLAGGIVIPSVDPLTLIVKCDMNGNVIWYETTPYFNTVSLVANNDGNLYGLGQFNSLACFKSANNKDQMITVKDSCTHSLLYSYDSNGNFLWGKPFNSPFNEYPKEIVIKDSCNTNLYFMNAFDTIANFMGNTIPVTKRVHIFKMNPGTSCSNIFCPGITTDVPDKKSFDNFIFKVIPNPNAGIFEIAISNNENMDFMVYNNVGQLIQKFSSGGAEHIKVDLSRFNSGIYFIIAANGKNYQKEKVIVIN
jgi:photosystem II stability/assembly factor-like uncharacterized protein